MISFLSFLFFCKLKSVKINTIIFQKLSEISTAYQAVIFFGNCIFKEVTGSFSNQSLQFPVEGVGAVFDGFKGFCIMEKS